MNLRNKTVEDLFRFYKDNGKTNRKILMKVYLEYTFDMFS